MILSLLLSFVAILGSIIDSMIFESVLIPGFVTAFLIDAFFGGSLKNPVLPLWLISTLIWFFSIILFFLVGSLIGWIVGKVKRRKQIS